jgi:hypothetical protein
MPGPVITSLSTVQCAHVGRGTPAAPVPTVTIEGLPVVTIASPYAIAACTFPAMTGGNSPPCVNGQFTVASTSVMVNGQPLMIVGATGTSIPNGTPMLTLPSQTTVVAS